MISTMKIKLLGKFGRLEDMQYHYFSSQSFDEVISNKDLDLTQRQLIISSMLRINILCSIQKAGSGHLGTSLSALEIMLSSIMYLDQFPEKETHFFSSKGHDAPALYACYEAFGQMKDFSIKDLRRIEGPSGHPDVKMPKVNFNTGSLGMGISKANGWISAGNHFGQNSKIILIIGDGEFQEGQNFESLMYLQNNPDLNPLIIMDSNGIQSDTWVDKVKSFKNLEEKIKSFGIEYKEIDGHNFNMLNEVIDEHFSKKKKSATFICANTIKGKGIKFAESSSFDNSLELYPHHAGAMTPDDYEKALDILIDAHEKLCTKLKVNIPNKSILKEEALQSSKKDKTNILESYKKYLLEHFNQSDIDIALDADLLKDAGSIEISRNHPSRFYEFGIAEQDMVSFASGLSSRGLIPWSHSFSCFLTTRAQEQIFNFCSEKRKGIFVGALAGPIPGGPGHSHQMLRDLALMGSMPFMKVFEPISPKMLKQFMDFQQQINNPFFIRIANCDIEIDEYKNLELPSYGELVEIKPISNKTKKVLIIQGAILLHEINKIIQELNSDEELAVYAAVWLNNISNSFIEKLAGMNLHIYETTVSLGSFASQLSAKISKSSVNIAGLKETSIDNLPECGANDEVLSFHNLDSKSILKELKK